MRALEIVAAIRSGGATATSIVETALARIGAQDGAINAFTAVTAERWPACPTP
jgi:1-carboxybiuret hydrolase